MTDLENRMEKVEGRVSTLEITVEKLSQKVDDFIAESRRNADRQDKRMEKLEGRLDAMSQKMDGTLKNIQNLTVAAMVGIGAAILGIGGISIAVISFVLSK